MRKLLTLTVAVSLVLGASAASGADDVQTILDKGIKAAGGAEKLAKFKGESWKSKGTVQFLGQKHAFTADYYFQAPDQFRFDMAGDFGGQKLEITAVLNGDKGWQKAMGMVEEMPKDKLDEFKHQAYTMWLCSVLPLKDKEFNVTALGESKADGKPVLGVKAMRKGNREVRLFFDKETGLLAKAETRVYDEINAKEADQEILISDWKEIGGNKYFTKLVIKRDGKVFLEEEFSGQKSVEKLDEKLFEKP